MAKGFKAGVGGGAALNFKVVGNPQPESAKENTIWLNTDVPIGAWYFIATQPENLNEGDVWFPTGTSSSAEFNALKKNGIQVYPLSAKQYVDGALVDIEAKSYQGGEWVDWFTYLYKDGNEFTDITGGWEYSDGSNNGESIHLNMASNSGYLACAKTKKLIDFTDVNTVCIKFVSGTITSGNAPAIAVAVSSSTSMSDANNFVAKGNPELLGELDTFALDVSEITGKYYLKLFTYRISADFYEVYTN